MAHTSNAPQYVTSAAQYAILPPLASTLSAETESADEACGRSLANSGPTKAMQAEVLPRLVQTELLHRTQAPFCNTASGTKTESRSSARSSQQFQVVTSNLLGTFLVSQFCTTLV